MTPAEIATARRWFSRLGHAPVSRNGATIVATPSLPDVWDANFATADPGADPAAVIAALDEAMPHSRWRVINIDGLNDPGFEAAIALAGFRQGAPIIEMASDGAIASPHPLPPVTLAPVESAADWAQLAALIRIDHAEGRRTGTVSDIVGEGLIAVMQRRAPPCAFSIIRLDGVAAGYGMIAGCPGGLGLIESLFTLPELRGRGVMSAFIVAAAARLRAQGSRGIFIDALAEETARHLYARLGFRPIAVTRRWTLDLGGRID